MYCYYNIQSDENFSKKIKRESLITFLQEINELQQQDHQTFKNKYGFPWLKMILIETNNGNYAPSVIPNEWVTLVAIVCSEDNDQNVYIKLFKKIADFLDWKIYLEDDDKGNELVEY